MAREKDNSMDSSEIPFTPDVFEPSINEPMPIHPPDTSYLTSMPELRQSTPEPFSAENVPESKWKPLIGTPSKPPIPEDVFVPDPSPARTFSDTASTTILPPSTPGSFIHQRRQGEYVPRPPIWTIYNMDGTISSSPDPPDLTNLTDTTSADELPFAMIPSDMLKNENRKPSTHNLKLSDLKRRGVIFDEQYTAMCNTFRETPLIVNLVQTTGPSRSPLPNDSQSSNEDNHHGNSTTNLSPNHGLSNPSTGPDEMNDILSPELHAEAEPQSDAIENGVEHGSIEHGGTGTVAHSNSSPGDPNISRSIPPANAENSATNQATSAEVCGSVEELQYDMIEGPGRSIERLSHYVDIRAKLTPEQSNPLANTMVEGSEVIFVGLTWLSDGSKYEFELPINCRYLVADIYGDFWALLVKIEPGLELGELGQSSFFGWKSKPKAPRRNRMPERKALIGARNDRRFFVYAPLCAFTLAMDGQVPSSQPEPNDSIASDSTSAYGGLAQASIRTHSETAEAEAIFDRFTFIPKEVYAKYVELCKSSQTGLVATNETPPPRGTENTNPSLRSNAQSSQFPTYNRDTNIMLRPRALVSQSDRSTKSAKNTPTQNIKEFFSRKKDGNAVAVPTTKLNEPLRTPRPKYGDGAGSPQEQSVVVAASAPQVQLSSLPLSLENISIAPPSDSSEQFRPSFITQPQSIEPLVRDTTLSREPTPSNDSMPSERRDSRQSSVGLAIPHRRSYVRSSSSDPTPKPIHTSPLAQNPSLARGSDVTQESAGAVPTKKSGKISKYQTAIRKAGGSIKNLVPAVLQGLKPDAQKDQSEQKKANTLGTARTRLIQPYINAAQSWKDFKDKRHQRKSILPSNLYQPPGTSNSLGSPQEPSAGADTNQDSQGADSWDAFSIDSNERLRRRLAATDPLPTTWSSVSTAGNEVPPGSAANSDSESSGHIPAPGRLGDHLREIAPDTTLRARLNKSTAELATPRKV